MKKTILCLLVFCMVFAAAAAGGRGEAAAAAPGEMTGTVTGIMMHQRPERFDFIIDEITKEYPGLRYEIESVQFQQLDNNINLAHASGAGYDFIMVNHSSIPQFVNAGVLQPLDDYIAGSSLELEGNYNQSFLDLATVDGKMYAVPWDVDCRVFAYNKSVFEQYNLDPPKTLDDMLSIASVLAQDGIYAIARNMQSPLGLVYDFGSFGLGMGARLYEMENGSYRAVVNSPEMVRYVEWAKEMWQYMPKDVSLASDMINEMFAQGRVAMTIFGPWNFFNIGQTIAYGEEFGLTIIPGEMKSGSAMGGWMLGIGASGKNKDAVWELIERSLQPENLAKTVHALPSDSRSYDYAPFDDPRYQIFDKQMQTAELPQQPTPVFNQVAEVFNRYFNEAVLGELSPRDAMEAANSEIQRLLDEI